MDVPRMLLVSEDVLPAVFGRVVEAKRLLAVGRVKNLSEAAKASADYDRQLNKQMTDDLVSSLEEAGMKINNPDLAPFAEATASVLTDNAATYGDLLDKLADWKAAR